MSVVMGADDTDASDVNVLARLSALAFAGVLPLINTANSVTGSDSRYRFDREHLRLSIHGESESARDSFERGKLAGLMVPLVQLSSLLGAAVVSVVLLAVATAIGSGAARPLATLSMLGFGVAYAAIAGCYWLSDAVSVVDHTTEPEPEALAAAQQEFVDGDLTESELADRVEEVYER